MEAKLVAGHYPLHTVSMSGIQGHPALAWPRSMGQLIQAIFQIRHLLIQGHFQGVLTTGGYIAAPAILAARSLNLPVILHESNAIPGKVTRWLGSLCTEVLVGMPEAAARLSLPRSQVVGTPVRQEFVDPHSHLRPQPRLETLQIPAAAQLIAVIGGSQGARGLNRWVLESAPSWLDAGAWIVHLTGQTDADEVAKRAPDHPQYFWFPFWADMAGLLQRADFAVSRAGAVTLAELAVTGTPAILIPYPYAAEDHQFHNAQMVVQQGAAVVLREENQNLEQFIETGLQWIQNPDLLREYQQHVQADLHRQAAQRLAKRIQAHIQLLSPLLDDP
jgi:UDP-N-acetylglucosamine--N-acetylmuramyl-(pentapeptide) pyrophosphoryl-undecaprenol N-acetylglucosamine transferase